MVVRVALEVLVVLVVVVVVVVDVQAHLLLLALHVASVGVLDDESGLVELALLVVGERELSEAALDHGVLVARRGMKVLTEHGRARRRVDVKAARGRVAAASGLKTGERRRARTRPIEFAAALASTAAAAIRRANRVLRVHPGRLWTVVERERRACRTERRARGRRAAAARPCCRGAVVDVVVVVGALMRIIAADRRRRRRVVDGAEETVALAHRAAVGRRRRRRRGRGCRRRRSTSTSRCISHERMMNILLLLLLLMLLLLLLLMMLVKGSRMGEEQHLGLVEALVAVVALIAGAVAHKAVRLDLVRHGGYDVVRQRLDLLVLIVIVIIIIIIMVVVVPIVIVIIILVLAIVGSVAQLVVLAILVASSLIRVAL